MDHDDVALPSHSAPSLATACREPAEDAEQIWLAGVAAVNSARLVAAAVQRDGPLLRICGEEFDTRSISRLIVVGAGKASAGMALGLEQALGTDLVDEKVTGWINVPGDCVIPLRRIHLHSARPAGLNEPTEAGVFGSEQIMNLISGLTPTDLCLVLISGGGSALLPLPVPGITLADKQVMTRALSRGGATIHDLNTVRKRLSRIKGGELIRAVPAGRMIALIISDVIGDPLDVIASGPTVRDEGTAEDALRVLERICGPDSAEIPAAIWNTLRRQAARQSSVVDGGIECRNCVIGNNATALDAAMKQARQLGYQVQSLGSDRQGFACDLGAELANRCLAIQSRPMRKSICLIGGGEPVVQLAATERPHKGGRNQEVALSALCRMWNEPLEGIAILSGGTDGEDGPTDAAGAICSLKIRETAKERQLDPFDALAINDSYTFFAACEGLLKTGPTQTNVMDLQVAVVRFG